MAKFNQVLLIDDDFVNNFLNKRIIENLGICDEIKILLNGEEAIHYIEWYCIQNGKKCPELIFLDLRMPVMDGFEFLKIFHKLKFKKDHVEMVVLTSSTDERDIDRIRSLGIKHYINKPLLKEKLMELIAPRLSSPGIAV
jgi:CheY-like chemotaxis protein